MEWENKDQKDWRVTGTTQWINKNDSDKLDRLKEEAGIYIFADRNHRVKYVGRASYNVKQRVKFQINQGEKARGASLVKVLYSPDLEADLITKYQPANNVQGKG